MGRYGQELDIEQEDVPMREDKKERRESKRGKKKCGACASRQGFLPNASPPE